MIFRLLSVILLLSLQVSGQPREVRTDLRQDWKVFYNNQYVDYNGQRTQAIHLALNDQFNGKMLMIESRTEFGVFVNGRLLMQNRKEARLSIDSVRTLYPGAAVLSVYAADHLNSLQTILVHHDNSPDFSNDQRAPSFFVDFVILAMLGLFIFFVILFRSNTNLTLDYLNVAKVFSIQSREEAITTGRIGSSANLLFFMFISLLSGLILMVIDYFGFPETYLPKPFGFKSAPWTLAAWIIISVVIFLLLMLKLVQIWIMSTLFNFKDIVRFQYFNFVRSMYASMVLTGLSGLVYFIGKFQNPVFFYVLLWAACLIMMISTVFLYLKLLNRTGASLFHLFSYLCGSEIIPIVIFVKVLLF
jgi:hypothetical protein